MNTVALNCQLMFQKMFKMVSIMVMGLFTFDDKDEINFALYSGNTKFIEWMVLLHKSMYKCLVEENCVHYLSKVIAPYGTNFDWVLLGNDSTYDVG